VGQRGWQRSCQPLSYENARIGDTLVHRLFVRRCSSVMSDWHITELRDKEIDCHFERSEKSPGIEISRRVARSSNSLGMCADAPRDEGSICFHPSLFPR